jgi:hypothetical protein
VLIQIISVALQLFKLEIRSVKDVKKPGLLDVNKPGRVGVWKTYGMAADRVAPIDTPLHVPNSTER